MIYKRNVNTAVDYLDHQIIQDGTVTIVRKRKMTKRKLWKEQPITETTKQQSLETQIIDLNKFMKEVSDFIKKLQNELEN